MNPAFCKGSRLASSSGERMYAPGNVIREMWEQRREVDDLTPFFIPTISPSGIRV